MRRGGERDGTGEMQDVDDVAAALMMLWRVKADRHPKLTCVCLIRLLSRSLALSLSRGETLCGRSSWKEVISVAIFSV